MGLRGRIFLASAFVAVVSLAAVLQLVTRRVSEQAEAELRRGLDRAALLVTAEHASRLGALEIQARLLADLPTLKASVSTGDPATISRLATDLRGRAGVDVMGVADARGRTVAWIGDGGAGSPASPETLEEGSIFLSAPGAVLQIVTVPILLGPDPPERLGALSLGSKLDESKVRQFESVTDARVAFALGGRIVASTLPPEANTALEALPPSSGPVAVMAEGGEYLAARRALTEIVEGPAAFILVSRTERLAILRSLRAALASAGLVALALALGLSWAVARTVSRPLANLTKTMREIAATGDLARAIEPASSWSDEDAAVVAHSFSALTEAIARFQREAAFRERLSTLGRLSAVIAHEVRNPLMIIKSSLATLRRAAGNSESIHEPAADIEHEVSRLSHLVDGVLDYARAPRLQYGPVATADLAKEALEAALVNAPGIRGELRVEHAPEEIVTDAERLRGVLVNILVNARDAVLEKRTASHEGESGEPDVILRVRSERAGVLRIEVEDRGAGLTPEQAARLFDPYFTTKRTGTGLGLAIARNVIEALGGTITALSREGKGTSMRIEIPTRPPEAA